jgi:hypothetical protein
MDLSLNYITNPQGEKVSVIISYKEWTEFEALFNRLNNKLAVLKSIKTGIQEVKEAREKGHQLQSLEDFLSEN